MYAICINFLKVFALSILLSIPVFGQDDVSKIDKNFEVATVNGLAVRYVDALKSPCSLEGFPWYEEGKKLYRIPYDLKVNGGIEKLSNHTSGGAVRFRTNSPYLAVRYKLRETTDMCHMPRTGSSGFDLFLKTSKGDENLYTIQPSADAVSKFQIQECLAKRFPDGRMRDITIWMPLYGGVESLEIGIYPKSKIFVPLPHKIKKPILFYGSSITQGGCASRPGNNYTTMLCRELDAEQINLGFSGNAKGEIAIAKAIASLDLAAFVYDYDYNAPNVEHLQKTHEPFFMLIREAHPDLPIIMMSKCSHADAERRDVIKRTYENARARGDKNVYFIDGAELYGGLELQYPTVDNCHPNDLGFYMMYKRVLPVLKEALNIK